MVTRARFVATLLVAGVLSLLACESLGRLRGPAAASLRTDSAEVGVHRSGFAYIAKIGFVYVNTTAKPVSKSGCGFPPWPALEKKVEGRWVSAYSPGYLECLTRPDFTLKGGETYHAVFDFMAYEPGHNAMPTLDVSSIDGIYRLRWDFAEGTDATVHDARLVRSTSNEFRMVLSAPPPPSSGAR